MDFGAFYGRLLDEKGRNGHRRGKENLNKCRGKITDSEVEGCPLGLKHGEHGGNQGSYMLAVVWDVVMEKLISHNAQSGS